MTKRKLLVTASTFPRWQGDTEPRFIFDYAKAMTKYYEVHVVVPMDPEAKEEENIEGVFVHRFHYFPIHKLETLCYPGAIVPRIKEKKIRICLVPFLLISMRHAIRKYSRSVDVVHAHWLIPQGIVQSTIRNVPYIVTGHGGDVTSLNMWPIRGMKHRTLSNAKAVIGVSNYICSKMRDICGDINPMMISMGCDVSKFSPAKRNEQYFSHEAKNIVFVGRLAEKKGLTYLIEAMQNIDAKLYIIGKGPLEDTLKEQVEREQITNKVFFAGAKTHDELPEILASADLMVAPSIVAKDGDQEGLPVSIMEAMASGLPVVAGISGGTSDIIEDGINGYILDARNVKQLEQRIRCILEDNEMCRRMGQSAYKTAEKYSYERIGEQYYRVIQSALEGTDSEKTNDV